MGEQEAQVFARPELRPEEMGAIQDTETAFFSDESHSDLIVETVQNTSVEARSEEAAADQNQSSKAFEAVDPSWNSEGAKDYQEGGVEEKGFLARAGARIGEFARARTPRKITAGLAAAAIAVGGAVEIAGNQTERAQADEETPALTGAALKKVCVQAGLRMPVINRSKKSTEDDNLLINPSPKRSQEWMQRQYWHLVPDDCNGSYKRFMWIKPEVQNHKNHKQWQGVANPRWRYIGATNRGGFGDKQDANYVDPEQFTGLSILVPAPKNSKTPFYRCTPGPRKTEARVKIRTKVKDVKTGKFVGQRVGKFPTHVWRPC